MERIRYKLIIGCGILLSLFSSLISAQEQLADLTARIRPSVVKVVTFDSDGQRLGSGSGFCVATNQIVTNKHVVKGSYRSEVITADGSSFRVVEIVSVDEEGDLALLKTEPLPSSTRPLTISKVAPRAGDKVVVIGNPLGLSGTVSDGIVSAFRDVRGIGKLIQITAPISPGSSGSPVVNAWGEVVGVATLNLEGGQNLNFAISSERIVSLWPNVLTTSSVARTNTNSGDGKPLTAQESFTRGVELYDGEYYETALGLFQQSIKLNPNSVSAQHYLGLTFYALKRYREAIAPFQAAINLDHNKNSIYNLGRIYLALGDKSAALEQQRILQNVDALKAKELLSQIRNISGYWKSSSRGETYQIIDDGEKILVKYFYTDNRNVKYEAQWSGDIALGYIFTDDYKTRFVFKAVDPNHIWFRYYRGLNLKDPAEKVLKKALSESEKDPDEIWTRIP